MFVYLPTIQVSIVDTPVYAAQKLNADLSKMQKLVHSVACHF